jgi:hypothetical protein
LAWLRSEFQHFNDHAHRRQPWCIIIKAIEARARVVALGEASIAHVLSALTGLFVFARLELCSNRANTDAGLLRQLIDDLLNFDFIEIG